MGMIKEYIGPGVTIKPEDIIRYESGNRAGRWVAEEKHDGFWAIAKTDERGVLYSLKSRTGQSFTSSECGQLLGLKTHLPNCELIGELETGTQNANNIYSEIKHRRLIIFDATKMLGESITHLTLENRRALLETALIRDDIGDIGKLIPLVVQKKSGFTEFYNELLVRPKPWIGEGIVLKRKDSVYKCHRTSGKVDFWVRCKDKNTVDYYVIGKGKTPSGNDNLDCGLWDGSKIVHILHVPLPKGYRIEYLVGKVIECEGWEIMRSGSLRSAQFKRIRNDKTMDMCI